MDKKLAAAIERDNEREDEGMPADDRITCYMHQTWAANCEGQHYIPTGGQLLDASIQIDRLRNSH